MNRVAWRFGAFELDPSEHRLLRDGKVVSLPPKAFEILALLVRNPGRLVKRQEVFDEVWPSVEVEDANLTNNITALRKVLGKHSIVSVPKYGYRFSLPVSTSSGLSQEACLLFAEAQQLLLQRSIESLLRSRDLLWMLIAHEPECAPAWAWLGRVCRFLDKGDVERPYHRKLTDAAFQRAFALDSQLPCAHQFFTNVQVDRGQALDALRRLLRVVDEGQADAHCFASLVQVCRFCGLHEASVSAHFRARELSPEIGTSIPHTYFARCEYESVVESYLAGGKGAGIYLDLCGWACLGFAKRAETEALNRLQSREWPPMFVALLKSLLHALRGEASEVRRICLSQEIYEDPESLLLLARNLAFSGCEADALDFLESAISGGLAIPEMLQGDPWLAGLKHFPEFKKLLQQSLDRQHEANQILKRSRASETLFARHTARVMRA